jgi:hypothetical protein
MNRRIGGGRKMSKRIYNVCIPIAGHAYIEVTAESEADAKEKAFEAVTIDHVEEWEALEQFNQGNICHCPSPWKVEITDMGEADDE